MPRAPVRQRTIDFVRQAAIRAVRRGGGRRAAAQAAIHCAMPRRLPPAPCRASGAASRGDADTVSADRLTTLLFVPGGRPDRFAKALASGADAVCVDLEDAVPQADKPTARAAALAALADPATPGLSLRINGVTTLAGLEDLVALAAAPALPALLLLPKVEAEAEIAVVRGALGTRTPPLVPLIESARGLRRAHAIAAAPGVAAVMFGGGDLAGELGVALAWEPLLAARCQLLLACAEAGVPAIDVPFVRLDDDAGLAEETARARALGFAAKAAIHPAQVAVIRARLAPSPADVAEAREAATAYAAAGGAAVRHKGRMLEAPIMRRYHRILSQAEQSNA